ncbi:MAG: sigma-70 family RNA polymerase sigma factor [bacterium]|nr:sigma-70 family RNA polymerase sigma factor [bacterium]
MSGINEKILLYQAQFRQDPEAFAKLYDEYVKRIYTFVYFKVSNHEEAEDITSEVFLKAWHYLSEKKEVKSFGGLVYRMARNCVIDLYRSRSIKPEFLTVNPEQTEELDFGDGGRWYADLSDKIETQAVLAGLKKLKQEYQEVITLRYVNELEIDEIAVIVGKGQVAVRVTLHRALKKLKGILSASSADQPKRLG